MISHTNGRTVQTAAATGDMPHTISTGAYRHAVQVVKTDGATPGAFSVGLSGSLVSDAGPWDAIGSAISTNNDIVQFDGIYRYIKINVATLASGDSIAVSYVGY